jgi:hypothetical protein
MFRFLRASNDEGNCNDPTVGEGQYNPSLAGFAGFR